MKTFVWTLLLLLFVRLTLAQDFVGHTHDILKVQFNTDATRLISYSAGDGWLCLWEVQSGRLLWRAKTEFIQKGNEYYTLTSFAFSPDQHLIASGSGNGTIQLWDAKTGKALWRVDAHKNSVTAVEFSPDGKTIVSAGSPEGDVDEIKVYRVEDGQLIKKLEGKSCTVTAMKFDDGNLLRTGRFDFGSSAILLPKTSVLFAVQRQDLKNGNAIRFGFTFQKDTDEKKVEDYGTDVIMRFRESDLPQGK